jgi:hypothetical protein
MANPQGFETHARPIYAENRKQENLEIEIMQRILLLK